MADDRTYVRVHDGMDEHPKIEGLSDAAFRALHRCWYYCSRQLTDGRLSDAAWRNRAKTPKVRRELVDARLVHQPGYVCPHADCPPAEHGFVQMHDYLDHQRSADEVAELKRKRAEAGAKGGKAKAKAVASAKQVLQQTGSKTVPSTDTETDRASSVGGETHQPNARDDEPPRCPRHTHLPRRDVPDCWACGQLREAWKATATADTVFERPTWCGHCDQWTRQREHDDGSVYRCPDCHPLVVGAAS